ncbi:hypothetical protein VNO78_20474 [Psophocarpus tetragonolobus]|uniref:Uncharacterized protein n=1 Tax=Psophocarpus tetragonolobus TaxID=3891 RepID=A0AAN9XHI7_PSOTE
MTTHLLLTLWALEVNLEKRSVKERALAERTLDGVSDGGDVWGDEGGEVAREDVEGVAELRYRMLDILFQSEGYTANIFSLFTLVSSVIIFGQSALRLRFTKSF